MAARAAAAAALLPANLAAKDFWDFSAAAFMAFWFLALVAARAFMVALYLPLMAFWSLASLALAAFMALALAAISFLYLARRRPEAALAAADWWAMAFWLPCIFFSTAAAAEAALPLAPAAALACLVDLSLTTALTRPLWSLPVLASAALWAALSALLAAACLAL